MQYTNKNLIALEFNSTNHINGSFKAFSSDKISKCKQLVINDFLSVKHTPNDKNILLHWEKTLLKKLKRKLLNKLIENN